uniref:Sortilin N-terminal domain-containing protein n=1 Tax=Hucho hucho TaxID=62062 RepID=A0A4W5KZR3_9TELE
IFPHYTSLILIYLLTSDLSPLPCQVILVSSSINERDQLLFISTDEGSSFQRQPLSFTAETLLFHPKEEDKVLAYCKEGKLYVSMDLGRKWTLMQERVTKGRIFW